MATNQTARVMKLIQMFNDNQKVCIEQLQNEYLWEKKCDKTIRRDLDVLKEYFPESFELIRGEKGCYKAITKKSFENFMKPEVLSLMVQTFNMASRSNMFESFDLDASDKAIITSKVNELNTIYEFKNKPFENAKSDSNIFKILEGSIKFQKCIIIEYPAKTKLKKISVKPYKILFMNENFYLTGEVENEPFDFSVFRISKIKTIEDTPRTYHKNLIVENFIKDIQTPFSLYSSDYKAKLIKIKLLVDKSKAYYFKSKNYLKSQKIEEKLDNGDLIVTYSVTQELEVEELIKRWMPNIKVLEPSSLKEKINTELREYLKD